MNKCIQKTKIPGWMTKGKTTLIQKDPLKRTASNNCRPITYLPMMWKILTAQIWEIYYSLISCGIFPEEQKECRMSTRTTKERLYIDQHILYESKTRRKTLAMAWIDYNKAYDIVPHCLKMYKTLDQVVQFIEKIMQTWRAELTAGGKSLVHVKIQRGIFQGDALSPLLFVIAMMPLNHILRKCTTGYKLSKTQEMITHLMYMDHIKLFAKNEKELEILIQTENIESIYRNGIWHRKRRRASNEKWQTTHDRRSRTTKSNRIQNARGKGNVQILWDIGSRHHQTSGNERKFFKRVSQKNQKITRDKILLQEPCQRDKYLGCPPRKILGTILEVD